MKNIQPEPTINNTTPNDSPKMPNGFTPSPHSLSRDSSLSDSAYRTWVVIEGCQGGRSQIQLKRETIANRRGRSVSAIGRDVKELTGRGFLEVVRTRGASFYRVKHPDLIEKGQKRPTREVRNDPYIKQEVIRNKKASLENNILDPLACFAETTISPRSTTPRPMRKDNLQPAAAAFESLRIGLFLDQLDTQGIQKPEQNRKISEILTALFAAGWKETDLIKELKRRITNPNARKGLTVTELQSLANTPKRLPHPAPAPISQPTRSEHQYEELEEAWVKVSPQEQADQYEESAHDWISIIRTDLKQRKRIG
jgi:hypothetical protein